LTPVLLDTGVLVALLDRSESRHAECVEAVNAIEAPLVTCEAVIAESCHLTRDLPGAADAILENVRSGAFEIPLQLAKSAAALQRIFRKYRDREVDLADVCLIHLATELKTGAILTLDSDFRAYRWGNNRAFDALIPWR
jgi:predicted nucleic acid-binding protein